MDTPGISSRTSSLGPNSGRGQHNSPPDEGVAAEKGRAPAPWATGGGVSVLTVIEAAARQDRFLIQPQRHTSDAARSAGPSVDPQAESANQAFQQMFADHAAKHDAFHELMRQAFGENYDYQAAEVVRLQCLVGDFGWMPDIVVVDPLSLSGLQSIAINSCAAVFRIRGWVSPRLFGPGSVWIDDQNVFR